MYDTYAQHLAEQKHAAFMQFQQSGYRDRAAWGRFIAAYLKLQTFTLKRNKTNG